MKHFAKKVIQNQTITDSNNPFGAHGPAPFFVRGPTKYLSLQIVTSIWDIYPSISTYSLYKGCFSIRLLVYIPLSGAKQTSGSVCVFLVTDTWPRGPNTPNQLRRHVKQAFFTWANGVPRWPLGHEGPRDLVRRPSHVSEASPRRRKRPRHAGCARLIVRHHGVNCPHAGHAASLASSIGGTQETHAQLSRAGLRLGKCLHRSRRGVAALKGGSRVTLC